jgi:pimeloyl-ACP methyl ester carboxylesterase
MHLDEPAHILGHSFGGGVAIQYAHDYPERVKSLVLINSIGGSVWTGTGDDMRPLAERPLWDWGVHFAGDLIPFPHITRVLPTILEDALPNLIRNPLGLWRVANLARQADLTHELMDLKQRQTPVVVVWGDKDRIVTRASFDAMCAAVGQAGEVIPGDHSWLLADPDAFGEVMTNIVGVADVARSMAPEGAAQA